MRNAYRSKTSRSRHFVALIMRLAILLHDDIEIIYDFFEQRRWNTSAVNVELGQVVASYCRLEADSWCHVAVCDL